MKNLIQNLSMIFDDDGIDDDGDDDCGKKVKGERH